LGGGRETHLFQENGPISGPQHFWKKTWLPKGRTKRIRPKRGDFFSKGTTKEEGKKTPVSGVNNSRGSIRSDIHREKKKKPARVFRRANRRKREGATQGGEKWTHFLPTTDFGGMGQPSWRFGKEPPLDARGRNAGQTGTVL